jgi:hypothetical protein
MFQSISSFHSFLYNLLFNCFSFNDFHSTSFIQQFIHNLDFQFSLVNIFILVTEIVNTHYINDCTVLTFPANILAVFLYIQCHYLAIISLIYLIVIKFVVTITLIIYLPLQNLLFLPLSLLTFPASSIAGTSFPVSSITRLQFYNYFCCSRNSFSRILHNRDSKLQ